MAYKVTISASADRDVDDIFAYIMNTLGSPQAAVNFADALDERYAALEENPLMYERSRNSRLAGEGYRKFVVGSYIVLYLVDEERQEVTIVRVFYGRRDYERYI
jgi:addiction module RelE/StbE family toxin